MNTTHFLRVLTAILSLAAAAPASAQCTGDLTGNGIVDGADLGTILSYWGPRTQDPTSIASDLDDNGLINGADLGLVLSSWGPCQTTITSITPNQGCIVGGTQITITGTYLGSTSAVTVGGALASSFTVVNQNTVQATTLAGAEGLASVGVTTAAGTITASQQFTYMPASVSAIVPNIGGIAGGTRLTISGDYLALTTGVTIGGTACTSLTIVSPTTLTAIVPAGTLGNADVVITGGKGTITVPGGYRYVSIVVPSWATLVEAQPDPAVVSDPFLLQAIAATGLAWRIRDTGSGMPMVLVPPGTFQMGAVEGDPQAGADERPQHSVTISRAFYLGQHEVTQAQWVAKMRSNPSYFQGGANPGWENRPVEQVSWRSIQGFLAVTDCRLPTEAEWEYACRAGTVGVRYADPIDDIAWTLANSGGSSRIVGLLYPNQFGLYDMFGNVHECVADSRMTYTSTSQVDPFEPGDFRIHRGGSWLDYSSSVAHRASWRSDRYSDPDAWAHVGFRVARNP